MTRETLPASARLGDMEPFGSGGSVGVLYPPQVGGVPAIRAVNGQDDGHGDRFYGAMMLLLGEGGSWGG